MGICCMDLYLYTFFCYLTVLRLGISQDVTALKAILRHRTPILQNRIFCLTSVESRQVVAYLWSSDLPATGAKISICYLAFSRQGPTSSTRENKGSALHLANYITIKPVLLAFITKCYNQTASWYNN